jgi:glycine cleavage system H protein
VCGYRSTGAKARVREERTGTNVMEFPEDLKYTREHEWVAVEGSVATIGITDHAQEQLGDVVFIELPSVGDRVEKADAFGVVESTKAVSDVYAPLSGEVAEVNDDLPDNPELLNEDPYGDGWMVKVTIGDKADLDDLMTADEYRKFIEESATE